MEGPRLSATVAYKFLRPGGLGPFSGHPWPQPREGAPGDWVEGSLSGGVCRSGVHACEAAHLPRWIWEELWEIELDGPLERGRHKLSAPRGRLLRRVEAWAPATAGGFAAHCAGRAAEHAATAPSEAAGLAAAMAADCERAAEAARTAEDPYRSARGAAVCSYIAALAAHRAGGIDLHETERDLQARWLARELGLSA